MHIIVRHRIQLWSRHHPSAPGTHLHDKAAQIDIFDLSGHWPEWCLMGSVHYLCGCVAPAQLVTLIVFSYINEATHPKAVTRAGLYGVRSSRCETG